MRFYHPLRNILITVLLLTALFHTCKPLSAGLNSRGSDVQTDRVTFLHDLTWQKGRETGKEQFLFDEMFRQIEQSDDFIVIDMFLLNGYHDNPSGGYRPLAEELTGYLLSAARRGVRVLVLTDEINGFYGAYDNPLRERLTDEGILFAVTPLNRLRDSNPLYSCFYRLFIGPWGVSSKGKIPNPFSPEAPGISIGSILRMLNFKGNHRKVLVTEKGVLVLSGNAHDASSLHSNTGLLVDDPRMVSSVLQGETAVWSLNKPDREVLRDFLARAEAAADRAGRSDPVTSEKGKICTVSFLTEKRIAESVLREIRLCGPGDRIDIGVFYLSHRGLIRELLAASRRGAAVRIILDSNKDAFGRQKNGVPNRVVADELTGRSGGRIKIRWYLTHGEQFHVKFIKITRGGNAVLLTGSCNFTRRNFENYNLEADLMVSGDATAPVFVQADSWYDRIWYNRDAPFTGDLSVYREKNILKYLQYRIMEGSGLCTF